MKPFFTTFLLLVFLALPAIVVHRLSAVFFGDAPWWRRMYAALCAYPLLIFLVLMAMAPFGLMKSWPVLIVMAVLAAASFALPGRPLVPASIPASQHQPWWQISLGVGLVAAVLGLFFINNYFHGTAYMSDDYAYHGPTISAWFRTGTLDHPRIMFPAYYPFNGHVVTLYSLFATGDLRWSWMAILIWLVLAIASFLVLTFHFHRLTLGWALLGVACFLVCSEVSWFHFYTLCPTDLVGAVAMLAGFAVAIPREGASRAEALASATLGAMLVGFAMGSKSTFALPGVFAGFGLLMMTMLGPSPLQFLPRLWSAVGLMAAGAFSTGSYWYLWNWIHAGNPVFPAKVLDFKGPGTERTWGETKLTYHIEHAPDWGILREIWHQTINWPTWLGYLSLVGLILCTGFIAWRMVKAIQSRSLQPMGHALVWMFLAGSVLIIQYPFMPYTGSFIGPELVINHRYFLFFFSVGVITLCWLFSRLVASARNPVWSQVILFGGSLAVAAVVLYVFPSNRVSPATLSRTPALVLGIVVALVTLALPWAGLDWAMFLRRRVLTLGVAGLATVLVIVGGLRERVLPPPYMSVIDIPITKIIPSMIEAIDQLPDGSRIGEFSLNVWEVWYLNGSRMQHEPVIMWENGFAMMPLHEAYYGKMIDVEYPRLGIPRQSYLPNPDTFADYLRQVPLDYLFITRYVTGIYEEFWPPQREHVQKMPEFELLWRDEYSEIYRRVPDAELSGPGGD